MERYSRYIEITPRLSPEESTFESYVEQIK